MPTLPMYRPTPCPDAWHQVTAPGGYEWWYFDAEDPRQDVQLVAIFLEGFPFHPGYLRRHAAFLRRPTARPPPRPGDFPCAYFVVYRGGRVLAQFMTQYPPAQFRASADAPAVSVGPNRISVEPRADGTAGAYRLNLGGTPWRLTWRGPRRYERGDLRGELVFRPAFDHPPHQRPFLSRALSGADHQWVVAAPRCAVSGRVQMRGVPGAPEVLEFEGVGYHDHNYGTGPIGPGLRRWLWGRVLSEERKEREGRQGKALTFHYARARDRALADEIHLIEADAAGVREVPVDRVEADWSRHTGTLLAYPSELRWKGPKGRGEDLLVLRRPRVVDSTPFYLRLVYEAVDRNGEGSGGVCGASGAGASAFCEVAYPNRLRWPVLGRMIEMSIHREAGEPSAE